MCLGQDRCRAHQGSRRARWETPDGLSRLRLQTTTNSRPEPVPTATSRSLSCGAVALVTLWLMLISIRLTAFVGKLSRPKFGQQRPHLGVTPSLDDSTKIHLLRIVTKLVTCPCSWSVSSARDPSQHHASGGNSHLLIHKPLQLSSCRDPTLVKATGPRGFYGTAFAGFVYVVKHRAFFSVFIGVGGVVADKKMMECRQEEKERKKKKQL